MFLDNKNWYFELTKLKKICNINFNVLIFEILMKFKSCAELLKIYIICLNKEVYIELPWFESTWNPKKISALV